MKAKRFISVVLSIAMTVSLVVIKPIQSKAAPSGGDNKEIEYNYAKLLQESLYFYDANMCGDKVGETSAFSWRDDCHTQDSHAKVKTGDRNSAVLSGVEVDVSGGLHDAGDHIKFSLTNGYAGTILGISYMEFKQAFIDTNSEEHLKTISNYIADYLKKCTILEGGSVKYFVYQVGDGDDHNAWSSPESQTSQNRIAYVTSSDNPATDQVSISAAALTLDYLNFGDTASLDYAKKLFAYAKSFNNKKCCNNNVLIDNNGSYMYNSTSWADDYCMAAALLYKATNDAGYMTEFNSAKSNADGKFNIYAWLSWDDVSALADYYGTNNADSLLACANNMKKSEDGYSFLLEWGSARYNCNTQFLGLLYDKAGNKSVYKNWSTNQMNYLLGNNSNKNCFVVGYNDYSAKYPHHRSASASYDASALSDNHHILLGALVGGPSDASGTYQDSQGDYKCNEVALDYNACLVGSAAALYLIHKDDNNVPKTLMTKDDVKNIELRKMYGVEDSPTPTPESSATPSVNPTPSPSVTPSPSATPVVTPSSETSATPEVSSTPNVTPSSEASASPEATPSSTPEAGAIPEASATPSVVPTSEVIATPAVTPTVTPAPTNTPADSQDGNEELGKNNTPLGEGALEEVADEAITSSDSDEGPAGAVFGKLQAKMKKNTKSSVTITWKKISGAKYIVYGNKCGSNNKFKKIKTLTSTSFTQKKLKKGTYYKYMIVAVKDGKVVSASKTIHIATKGGKVGNDKKVTLNKTKKTLKVNKTFKIKAKTKSVSKKLKVKKHRAVSYESSNENVAAVTGNGTVKAVGKGTAYIYAYAQDGAMAKVKITVK